MVHIDSTSTHTLILPFSLFSSVTSQEKPSPSFADLTVVNVTVVGPFEEEEEGTGIASDVVKVEGEDPATPGLLQ